MLSKSNAMDAANVNSMDAAKLDKNGSVVLNKDFGLKLNFVETNKRRIGLYICCQK